MNQLLMTLILSLTFYLARECVLVIDRLVLHPIKVSGTDPNHIASHLSLHPETLDVDRYFYATNILFWETLLLLSIYGCLKVGFFIVSKLSAASVQSDITALGTLNFGACSDLDLDLGLPKVPLDLSKEALPAPISPPEEPRQSTSSTNVMEPQRIIPRKRRWKTALECYEEICLPVARFKELGTNFHYLGKCKCADNLRSGTFEEPSPHPLLTTFLAVQAQSKSAIISLEPFNFEAYSDSSKGTLLEAHSPYKLSGKYTELLSAAKIYQIPEKGDLYTESFASSFNFEHKPPSTSDITEQLSFINNEIKRFRGYGDNSPRVYSEETHQDLFMWNYINRNLNNLRIDCPDTEKVQLLLESLLNLYELSPRDAENVLARHYNNIDDSVEPFLKRLCFSLCSNLFQLQVQSNFQL
jgi:hypothetical protein